jgi:hypothetical protein
LSIHFDVADPALAVGDDHSFEVGNLFVRTKVKAAVEFWEEV